MGHGEGLAGASDAQQHLLALAIAEPGFKLFYCLRLIAGRLEHSFKLEFGGGPGGGTFLKDGVHKSI